MSTFLATRRMSPALVARIEASVRGRRPASSGPATGPRLVSLFRLVTVVVIVASAVALVLARHRGNEEFERSRRTLLDAVHAHSSLLTQDDHASVARAESWLLRSAGSYEGDLVSTELKQPGALTALLGGPVIYVRGPLVAFNGSTSVAPAAQASFKDAFMLCLLEPPASRSEKAVLAKVHAAYSGISSVEARTPNVRRLGEAEVGLPLLTPAWAARVSGAKDESELSPLRQEFGHAPLKAAEKAATARLFVFAMDEPGEPGGLSELDGERAHDVRIGIVDLGAAKILLRLKKRVDPSWISLSRRADYAAGLDACALALDVRDSVAPPPVPTAK